MPTKDKAKRAEAQRRYAKKNASRRAEKNKKWQAKQVAELGGSYVRRALIKLGIPVTEELVAMKVRQLYARRLALQLKRAAHESRKDAH